MEIENVISTHSHNIVFDNHNNCIRNEKDEILVQRIGDNELMFFPGHDVEQVFGSVFEFTHDHQELLQDISNDNTELESQQDEMEKGELDQENCNVENITKRLWTYEETVALISAVESHEDHLHHPTKRRHVWTNISNLLLSQNISFPSDNCKKKWLNLVKTYENVKDNKTKTGRLFFDSIDEILRTAPNICFPHTLNVISEPNEQTQSQFPENNTEFEQQPAAIMNEDNPKDEIIFQSAEESEISNNTKQNRNRPMNKKKTNLMKLREEIADLRKKTKEKKDAEEKKLHLLGKKLKLDKRKIAALEKIAGITSIELQPTCIFLNNIFSLKTH